MLRSFCGILVLRNRKAQKSMEPDGPQNSQKEEDSMCLHFWDFCHCKMDSVGKDGTAGLMLVAGTRCNGQLYIKIAETVRTRSSEQALCLVVDF